jgi:isoquinoline 1-oxidoreductase subunit alpha
MELRVNGCTRPVDVEGDTPLLWVLRETLGLTGTKYGCGIARCGACTVLLDGVAVRSCVIPVDQVGGQHVRTIEDLSSTGTLDSIQQAWLDENVPQCGYCQPGQIMAAVALLKARHNPSREDVDLAMAGNLCRCGTYPRIRAAIKRAAAALPPGKSARRS